LACMPDALGVGTAFSALVAAKCPPSTVSSTLCDVHRRAGLCVLLGSPRWHWLSELASRPGCFGPGPASQAGSLARLVKLAKYCLHRVVWRAEGPVRPCARGGGGGAGGGGMLRF
jgi:hypothetical protein